MFVNFISLIYKFFNRCSSIMTHEVGDDVGMTSLLLVWKSLHCFYTSHTLSITPIPVPCMFRWLIIIIFIHVNHFKFLLCTFISTTTSSFTISTPFCMLKPLNRIINDHFIQRVPNPTLFILLSNISNKFLFLKRLPMLTMNRLIFKWVNLKPIYHLLLVDRHILTHHKFSYSDVFDDFKQIKFFS